MAILPQVKHIIVVMLENRSFDSMCGWLYKAGTTPQPRHFLPPSSSQSFDGLNSSLFNPANASYFIGKSTDTIPVSDQASSNTNPNPDPEETFPNVTYQLFGPEAPSPNPKWPNLGFAINYTKADPKASSTPSISNVMSAFSPAQLPVLSALATNFAISDRYFCSVPSQTWPNRSFVHAGTSNGHVNNGSPPNPFDWDVHNIYNVLSDMKIDWRIYSDTDIFIPSLTRIMFPNLWTSVSHFHSFDTFKKDCSTGNLAKYTFLEPSFLVKPNDQHPPHDVTAGEQFLHDIYTAVSQGPAWNDTLLMVTYDEHGGLYDHVQPPFNAVSPDEASSPGEENFTFDRFGVRVPAILISPYIAPGTVFRSPTTTPFDHTSVLATLRDWLEIPEDKMLKSARIAAAPTFESVLTLEEPRKDIPAIPKPKAIGLVKEVLGKLGLGNGMEKEPNDLQTSLIAGHAVQLGADPSAILNGVKSKRDVVEYFKRNKAKPSMIPEK